MSLKHYSDKVMKRSSLSIIRFLVDSTLQLFIVSTIFLPSLIHGESPPSAQQILASVRMIEARQQIDLQGQLRENDVVVPFRLIQNGPLIPLRSSKKKSGAPA